MGRAIVAGKSKRRSAKSFTPKPVWFGGTIFGTLDLRRREILAFEEFPRESEDFTIRGLIQGFDAHDARRKQRRVIADKAREFLLGRAVTDNQDFMRRLQRANDRCQIRLAVMGVPRTN